MLVRIVTLLAVALATVIFAQQRFAFTRINDPSTTAYATYPFGINRIGQIVGYYLESASAGTPQPGKTHGFLLESSGGFTMIDDPLGSQGTSAGGINAAGQVVGSYYTAGGRAHGFLYNSGSFSTIEQPSAANTFLSGINAAGQIVGSYSDASGYHGLVYNRGSFMTINHPLAVMGTSLEGINAAGQIVGHYYDASERTHGFVYVGTSFTSIDDPRAYKGALGGTVTTGINDAGHIVGYYFDAHHKAHGFLYKGETFIHIDNPLAIDETFLTAVNDAGKIVGYSSTKPIGAYGFWATSQ